MLDISLWLRQGVEAGDCVLFVEAGRLPSKLAEDLARIV